MLPTARLELFAGISVTRYAEARPWYERLLGTVPAFFPHETEAVWELAKHRYVYIVEQPEHAGHAQLTVFVEGLEQLVAGIGARGLEPVRKESFPNGVQKISYRDPDGNEIGFGGSGKRRTSRGPRSGRASHSRR